MLNTTLAQRRRKELGLSLQQVADRIGVFRQSVSDWELGKHEPTNLPTLKAYAQVLGVSVEELTTPEEVASS